SGFDKAVSVAFAQATPRPTPIANPALATYFGWSLDDRYLFYSEDTTLVSPNNTKSWTIYDTQTQSITRQTIPPFLPKLSPQELAAFAPAPNTFYFGSPDNNYVVFFRGSGKNNWSLWIGNRTTGATFKTGIVVWDATDWFKLHVEWSKDSSAF